MTTQLPLFAAIDYEVYYDKDYSVSKLPIRTFVNDQRFDPYLVSICLPELMDFYVGPPADAPWDEIDGRVWVTHNVKFDRAVHERATKLGIVPAQFRPSYWACSMALVAPLQTRRNLANAAKVILEEDVSKAVRASAEGRRWPHDFLEEDRTAMIEYARRDALLCAQLYAHLLAETPEVEEFVARHTDEIPFRGIHVDREALLAAKKKLRKIVDDLHDEVPGGLSIPKLHAQIRRHGGTPPPTTDVKKTAYQKWAAANPEHVGLVEKVQKLRSVNKTLKLLMSIEERLDADGNFDAALKYYGADVTGRWAGAGGVNMQNLPKNEIEGINVRHLFIPRPGKKFIIADFSAIEPRCLAWLTGNEPLLAHLRNGVDLYEAHARATMGYEDPRPLKDVDKDMRQLAKIRVLALGYGMGSAKFLDTALAWGIEMSPERAKREVQAFRRSNTLTTKFWVALGNELTAAATRPSRTAEFELPSGRVLRYFAVRKDSDGQIYGKPLSGGDVEYKLYGGLLCENVVQAMARDVLASAIYRIEKARLRVAWHVHDEVIVEVPERTAPEALHVVEEIMKVPPAWAADLPLDVDAHIATRYDK